LKKAASKKGVSKKLLRKRAGISPAAPPVFLFLEHRMRPARRENPRPVPNPANVSRIVARANSDLLVW
jgi:hypothetical protein